MFHKFLLDFSLNSWHLASDYVLWIVSLRVSEWLSQGSKEGNALCSLRRPGCVQGILVIIQICYQYFFSLIFFSVALPTHSEPWPLIQFRNHFSQTVGLLGRVISSSQGRYLNAGQHKHRINTYTHQKSMPWVGFEPTIPVLERANTVHALDRAATVTGSV
jgi:hypothetical protein